MVMVVGTGSVVGASRYLFCHGYHFKHTRKKTMSAEVSDIIIDRVSQDTGITKKMILSKYRHQEIVDARQIIMFCLTQLGFTQQSIAKYLNYKDHTTVNHHLNKDCRISLINKLRATQIVNSYLNMALMENALLIEDLEAKISEGA